MSYLFHLPAKTACVPTLIEMSRPGLYKHPNGAVCEKENEAAEKTQITSRTASS